MDPLAPLPVDRSGRGWPWLLVIAALAWAAVIRLPMMRNARSHLDSDLAVDGLALISLLQGEWRWHLPGTPSMGIGFLLPSVSATWMRGVSPSTLVSGGVLSALLILVLTFALAWRAFGRSPALFALIPLTFASSGSVWLSGRISGGHLLTAAWHAGGFLIMAQALSTTTPRLQVLLWSGLGIWSGLGLALDPLHVFSLCGLGVSLVIARLTGAGGGKLSGIVGGLLIGLLLGLLPAALGRRSDPHDAYPGQLALTVDSSALTNHARLLVMECLPRLVTGHLLADFAFAPRAREVGSSLRSLRIGPDSSGTLGVVFTALALTGFVLACVTLIRRSRVVDPLVRAIAAGQVASGIALTVGFLLNRNIFNSDNYRYLVPWLVIWPLGLGLWLDLWSRRGRWGVACALGFSLMFAMLATADLAQWYQRFGWLDSAARRGAARDPMVDWLRVHPEIQTIEGDYWDVYRLAFLMGGGVRAVPFPVYPDRFQDWSRPGPSFGPTVMLARPDPLGREFQARANLRGGTVLERVGPLTILKLPEGPIRE